MSEARSARGGIVNGAAAAVGTGVAFLTTFVIANHYGVQRTGVFFGAASAFMIIATATKLGAETGLVLFLSRLDAAGQLSRGRRAVAIAVLPVLIASMLAGLAMWFTANSLAQLFTEDAFVEPFRDATRSFAPFVPAWSLSYCLLGATRGLGTMVPTAYGLQLVQPLTQFALTGLAVTVDATLGTLALLWAAPIALTLLGAAIATQRMLPSANGGAPHSAEGDVGVGEFWGFAIPRGIAGSLQISLERIGVLIVGALTSAAIAGQWAALSRLVGVAQRIFHAIGQSLNPRISALAEQREWAGVSSAVDRITQWTILVLGPALLGLAVFPRSALGLFGEEFVPGATALRIAALAVLAASLLAHSDNVLLMSGASLLAMRNTALALIVAVALYFALTPAWEAIGAAVAFSAGTFVYRVTSARQIMRFGVRPFGRQSLVATAATLAVLPVLIAARVIWGDHFWVALGAGVAATLLLLCVVLGLRRRGSLELGLV